MSWYQIETHSIAHFKEVFGKLAALGFVYSECRIKEANVALDRFGWYPVIVIGEDEKWRGIDGCKMVLHASVSLKLATDLRYKTVDVDNFIKYIFPEW